MKNYLSSIISVCILTIFVNRISIINALKITNTFNEGLSIKTNGTRVSLLLNTISALCIASRSEEMSDDLFELLFKDDYKPVTLNDFTEPLLTCDGILIIETNKHTVTDCEGSIDSYPTTVVYVTKDYITADFSRSLEACLSVTQSQEVLALSLSDGSLLQLSSVFPQPRHFVSTSVTEVLQRRGDKWKELDLKGSALNIGALYYVPFFFQMKNKAPASSDEYDGIYLQLVKEMARQFNFTCTYLVYSDWGIALPNGTWIGDGLSPPVDEGKIDIIAVNMWISHESYETVDYGPSLNEVKLTFLVFRPELIDFQWQAILGIFRPKVWFSILVSFVLMVVVYWAGVNWDPRPCTESWCGCLFTIFGFFTISSTHSVVDEGNTRFALTSWSVFSLLITTCLSTGIVTRLTVPSFSPRVDSVEQLVEGDYFWTTQFYADYLNSTVLRGTIFNLQNHWIKEFEERYVYVDEDEVTRTAGQDKKMTFLSQMYGDDFVLLETEGLEGHKALNKYRVAKESITEAHVTFGVKKQSFLLEPLTEFSLLIVQAGLMTRWRDEVIRRWPEHDTRHLLIEQDIQTFSEPQGLPFYKVQPVFNLLLFGLGLASFVLFIEICWQSIKRVVSMYPMF